MLIISPKFVNFAGITLCFWLRRRLRRRRTPMLVQAITKSPIKFLFAIAIELTDYKNPKNFGINRKNKMASGGHIV